MCSLRMRHCEKRSDVAISCVIYARLRDIARICSVAMEKNALFEGRMT